MHLAWLQKPNISTEMCSQFYRATIESILTSSMSVLYSDSTVHTKHQLDRTINLGSKLTGKHQQLLMDLHSSRVVRRASNIAQNQSHPAQCLFKNLSSGSNFCTVLTAVSLNSFVSSPARQPESIPVYKSLNNWQYKCDCDYRIYNLKHLSY